MKANLIGTRFLKRGNGIRPTIKTGPDKTTDTGEAHSMCLLVVLSGPISLYCSGPYGLFTLPTFPLLCLFVLFLFPAYLKEERKR